MFGMTWALHRRESDSLKDAIAGLLGKTSGQEDGSDGNVQSQQESAEPATIQAAEAVSAGVFDHTLTDDEEAWAGPAVHYSFGTSAGAIYGLLAEAEPRMTAGAGLPSGANFWFESAEGDFGAHGPFDGKAKERSPQLWATKHKPWVLGAAAVASLVGTTLARRS